MKKINDPYVNGQLKNNQNGKMEGIIFIKMKMEIIMTVTDSIFVFYFFLCLFVTVIETIVLEILARQSKRQHRSNLCKVSY